MSPYCDGPVPQLCVEKSSVKLDDDDEFELVFVLVTLEFAFELRFVDFQLLLFELFELLRLLLLLLRVMLATAKIKITSPMPMNTTTAPMPRSQGQTLRFCGWGIGDQPAGAGGGGGGGACPGFEAIVGCGDRSRAGGHCTVAPEPPASGALTVAQGEPSARQQISAS